MKLQSQVFLKWFVVGILIVTILSAVRHYTVMNASMDAANATIQTNI